MKHKSKDGSTYSSSFDLVCTVCARTRQCTRKRFYDLTYVERLNYVCRDCYNDYKYELKPTERVPYKRKK